MISKFYYNHFTNKIDRIGFSGKQPDYTVTNDNTDRKYNADTVAIAELADVVATLVKDLISLGILK